MRWWIALVLMAAATAACSPSDPASTTTTVAETASTTSTIPGDAADVCVAGDLDFDTDGLIAAVGDADADATTISQMRWEPQPSCERLVISFATQSGAPATTLGVTGVTVIGFEGIVRVDLPDAIAASAVADQWTDGLIDRTYVFRDEDGNMFVDVHTASTAGIGVRAFTVTSPASLVIDVIEDASLPQPTGAATSDSAVIVAPLSGPALYPFTIEAYAPPQRASTSVVVSTDDIVSSSVTVGLPGYTDTWQSFTTRIDDGPSGVVTVFVGTVSPDGATGDGASVALDLP